jgi:hypothetical protein
MKIRVLIAALFLLGMSSCAYKTCPTYAKNAKEVKQVEATAKVRG